VGDGVVASLPGTATRGQREAWDRIANQWIVRNVDDTARDEVETFRAVCVRGPAGAGKSYVLVDAARRLWQEGARVAITSFTALVADHYRAQCSFATCDTVRGLIRFALATRAADSAAALLAFDVVIVDEVFMVPVAVFDALMEAWLCVDRLPLLIFAGDEGQLQPFGEDGEAARSVTTSVHWRLVDETRLTESMRANGQLW